MLDLMHHYTSGMKAVYTQETYDYIYGSKDKNWAPYSNDIEQQITTYLGPDDAQPYLTKMNTNNTSILQKKYNDFTNKLSIPISPNSFMMSAVFCILSEFKSFDSKVVLPLPKKPVMIDIGIWDI